MTKGHNHMGEGAGKPSKGGKRVPERDRQEEVLDASTRHINEFGVSEVSFENIARNLGVTRASLYYYVSSRSDLVFQVCRRSQRMTLAALEAAHSAERSALRVLEHFLAKILDPQSPEISVMAETGLLNDKQRIEIDRLEDEIISSLRSLLRRGIQECELRNHDDLIVSKTILSIIRSVPHVSYWAVALNKHEFDRHALIATIFDLLSIGWIADRSSPQECDPVDISGLRTPGPNAFDKKALAETRAAIIVTMASKIFNRRGIDSTSIEEIASATSTTKPTIYRLVGNKESLLMKCYEKTIFINRHIFREALINHKSSSDVLFRILVSIAFTLQDEELEAIRPQVGYYSLPDELQVLLAENDRKLMGFLFRTFIEMEGAGDIRKVDYNHLSAILMGAMAWLIRRDTQDDLRKRARIASEVTNVLRLGLRSI